MGKSTKSHQIFKDKAKNRVDDLHGMFTDLQLARKESRTMDIALLENRVHEMLQSWQAELNDPSPASSQNDCSLDSLGSGLCRLLQHCEEKDDAISPLAQAVKPENESDILRFQGGDNGVLHEHREDKDDAASALAQSTSPKPDPESNIRSLQVGDTGVFHEDCSLGSFSSDLRCLLRHLEEKDDATSALTHSTSPKPGPQSFQTGDSGAFNEVFSVIQTSQEHGFQVVDHYFSNEQYLLSNNSESANQLHNQQFDFHQNFSNSTSISLNGTGQCEGEDIHHFPGLQPRICPLSSAFLGPKCALWDCSRPAGSGLCPESPDYCSGFHANLAWNEGSPGMTPILRPGGIGLTDGALFSAVSMKMQGKDVGIPECVGAATKKSPWNAPELFDINFLEGEKIREWLFFDKPRKAFNKGRRKQRSLPDYEGRGWHESRKQPVKEHGGMKRSYYMDPQPLEHFEWHLYEYEMDNCDALTLYRMELKLADKKKSPKGKISKDSLADLQKQMGRLTAEFPEDNKLSVQHGAVANSADSVGNVYSAPDQMSPTNNYFDYKVNAQYG